MGKQKVPNPLRPQDRLLRGSSPPPTLTFSFQYYDQLDDEYCISTWERQEVRRALLRLREISGKTYQELSSQKTTYHFHEVDWKKTTKRNGFPDSAANNLDAYQFALPGTSHEGARVYAAFANNIFYIVWIDLHHKIWPVALKNT